MYVVTVEMKIDPAHRDEFREVICRQAATSVKEELGCHVFDISVSSDDPNLFFLYEIYEDRAAFDLHVQQPHSKHNGSVTKPWIQRQTIQIWSKECN